MKVAMCAGLLVVALCSVGVSYGQPYNPGYYPGYSSYGSTAGTSRMRRARDDDRVRRDSVTSTPGGPKGGVSSGPSSPNKPKPTEQ
jgi:hypothetical protein